MATKNKMQTKRAKKFFFKEPITLKLKIGNLGNKIVKNKVQIRLPMESQLNNTNLKAMTQLVYYLISIE